MPRPSQSLVSSNNGKYFPHSTCEGFVDRGLCRVELWVRAEVEETGCMLLGDCISQGSVMDINCHETLFSYMFKMSCLPLMEEVSICKAKTDSWCLNGLPIEWNLAHTCCLTLFWQVCLIITETFHIISWTTATQGYRSNSLKHYHTLSDNL